MQNEFLGRINGITLSNTVERNTIYVGYGTPGNITESALVLQRFRPFTANSFPPQPLETLEHSAYNEYAGPPEGNNMISFRNSNFYIRRLRNFSGIHRR